MSTTADQVSDLKASDSDVPRGCKWTEVGTIPCDWDVVLLGDAASVCAGGTPSRSVPAYWNGSIPWITTTEVDFGTIMEAQQFITEKGLRNSAKVTATGYDPDRPLRTGKDPWQSSHSRNRGSY